MSSLLAFSPVLLANAINTGRKTITTGVLFMKAESGITIRASTAIARPNDFPAHFSNLSAIQSIAPVRVRASAMTNIAPIVIGAGVAENFSQILFVQNPRQKQNPQSGQRHHIVGQPLLRKNHEYTAQNQKGDQHVQLPGIHRWEI